MNNRTISDISFEIMKRVMAALLLLASGVHCCESYYESTMIVIGWIFIVISIGYMLYLGYISIAIWTKSRG